MADNRIARMRSGVTVPENQREILPDLKVKEGDKVLVQLADGTVGMALIGAAGGLAPSESLDPTGEELSPGVTLAPVTIVEGSGVAPEGTAIALHIEAVEIGNA